MTVVQELEGKFKQASLPSSRKKINSLGGWVKKSIIIVIFILIWEALPNLKLVDRAFFPPFTEVADFVLSLLR